jgi:hypothetical protein
MRTVFVMQPHRNSCSSTSKLRVLANRKSSKWKPHLHAHTKSVEPSHAPPVPQDKQFNSSNSSYSNWKPPKYGFQMPPHNSSSAFADNWHLYKPFPQDTGMAIGTVFTLTRTFNGHTETCKWIFLISLTKRW